MTVQAAAVPAVDAGLLGEDEREELRQPVARFLERLAGRVPAVGAPEADRRRMWRALATEMDLVGIHVPVQHGGQGLTLAHTAVVSEQVGRLLLPVPYLASACLATGVVLHADDSDMRTELLSRLVSGEAVATVAGDEHDPGAPTTAVPSAGGQLHLRGSKTFVPYGADADVLLVLVDAPDGSSRVMAVEGDAPGLVRTPLDTLDESRPQALLRFDDTPARVLPGADGPGLERAFQEAMLLLAAEAVGGAAECVRSCADYARSRRQFGQPIGSFQAVQQQLADLHGEVESARAAVEWAVSLAASESADPTTLRAAASTSAARAADAYATVTRGNIHLHGGIGFTWEHPAHRYFKRALTDRQLFGGSSRHRHEVATALFG